MGNNDDIRRELNDLRRLEALERKASGVAPEPDQTSFGSQAAKIGEGILGVADAGLTMATGAASTVPAGLLGIGAELREGGYSGAQMVRKAQQAGTWTPKTKTGNFLVDALGKGGMVLEEGVDWIATSVSDNPIVQTAVKTGLLGIPEAAGLHSGITNRVKINKQVRQIESIADELGVDFSSKNLPAQVSKSGVAQAVDFKGQKVGALPDILRTEKARVKARRDALYEEARGTNARLRSQSAEELALDMMDDLMVKNQYIIEDMPKANMMLDRVIKLSDRSFNGEVIKIDEIFNLRKSINQNRPSATDAGQNAAMSLMVKRVDKFLDDALFNDMVKGDATAIQKWRDAADAHKDYRIKFHDNQTIAKIIEKELTPEEVKNLVFGARKAGDAPGASTIVKRVKNILGDTHPQIEALRQEMLLPVISPLMKAKPDFKKFSANVNDLMQNNRSLVKELTPHSLKPIMNLKKVADAAIKSGAAPGFELDIAEAMSRILFGHQIAKAALKVKTATLGIKYLKGVGESERRALMTEMLGVDTKTPLINKKSVWAGAFLADQANLALERAENEIPAITGRSFPR